MRGEDKLAPAGPHDCSEPGRRKGSWGMRSWPVTTHKPGTTGLRPKVFYDLLRSSATLLSATICELQLCFDLGQALEALPATTATRRADPGGTPGAAGTVGAAATAGTAGTAGAAGTAGPTGTAGAASGD